VGVDVVNGRLSTDKRKEPNLMLSLSSGATNFLTRESCTSFVAKATRLEEEDEW
jgi:hypothetical protein